MRRGEKDGRWVQQELAFAHLVRCADKYLLKNSKGLSCFERKYFIVGSVCLIVCEPKNMFVYNIALRTLKMSVNNYVFKMFCA